MAIDKPDQPDGDKAILIYTTFPTLAAAESVAASLVDAGLVACANILPSMVAIYHWQGERHRDQEVVMILKTRAALADRVMAETRARHPYDTPALLVLDPVGGSDDYLAWIAAQTAAPRQPRNNSDASP